MTNPTTNEKLASSLSAETTNLIPHLPYLLQDFWELGAAPSAIIDLTEAYIDLDETTKVLDLACGKGAVSIKLAQALELKVKGIDILPEFIKTANQKAKEHHVEDLCNFKVGDINEAVTTEKGYDLTILGAVSGVLGTPEETLKKLKATIKRGGYIIIDEAYLKEGITQSDINDNISQYLTETQWLELFKKTGLNLVETVLAEDIEDENFDSETAMGYLTTRANELIEKYPDKKEMFEGYLKSQQNEYDDLDTNLVGVMWILHRG